MVEKCTQEYEEYFLLIINLKKLRRGVYTTGREEGGPAQDIGRGRASGGGGRVPDLTLLRIIIFSYMLTRRSGYLLYYKVSAVKQSGSAVQYLPAESQHVKKSFKKLE